MIEKTYLHRGLIAALILSLAVGVASAATTTSTQDLTRIALRTQSGAVERLSIANLDAIAPGENRTYTSEAGATAYVSRNEQGISVLIGGERFDIRLPTADLSQLPAHDADGSGLPGAHTVSVEKRIVHQHDGAAPDQMHKIIIVKKDGDGETPISDSDLANLIVDSENGSEPTLGDPEPGKRVKLMRTLRHTAEDTAAH
jgi:hypothetical protein